MLTDPHCKNATCPADKARVRLADSGGLYLEVTPNGAKRWFWKYRKDGKEGRLALGSYPAVSLTAARRGRDAARLQKAEGIDPVQARKVEKAKALIPANETLEGTAKEWLELNRSNWSETHYVREKRNVEKDLLPFLGRRPIGAIEPIELLGVIRRVEERGALDVARRVRFTAGGIWSYAVATGRASRDISQDIKKALKPRIKENYAAIIDPEGLAQLLRASAAYKGGPIVRAALKIAPILFQRPGNLRTMRWVDLDLEKAVWSIPSEDMKRTKSQKINGQNHVVPLPRQVVAILKDVHQITGRSPYVFPGMRDHEKPLSDAAIRAALDALGYKGIHTWHGYRATGRTILRQVLKYPADVIEAQLAHKGQITHGGAYDRATFVDERTTMLQTWADYLDQLVSGAKTAPANTA